MKKLSFLFIMVVASVLASNGQDWVFAQQFASTGAVEPVDSKIDSDGNIYVVGNYINELTIGGSTVVPYSDLTGKEDIFVCKFSQKGDIIWANQIASTRRDLVGGLALDPSDNIYVVGGFQGDTLRFEGESPEFFNSTPGAGKYDAFIAKYNTSGTLLAADSVFKGTNVQRLLDVTYDYTKNYVVTVGQFQGELKYDSSGAQVLPAISEKDHLLARLDPGLAFVDKVVFNGSVKQSVFKNVNRCVISDTVNSYYVTGDLVGNLLDASSTLLLSANDAINMDIMVLRINDQLGYLWGRKGGGAGYDHINSSGSDDFGNIYFTGKTDSPSTIIDSTASLSSAARTSLGGRDYTIAKYNRNGNLRWFNREGGPGTDNAYGLSVRGQRLLFTGNLDNNGNISSGFAVYNLDGDVIITDSITGDGIETGLNVIFGLYGDSTLVIGTFDGDSLKAGADFRLDNTLSGVDDGFLVKYGFQFSVFEVDKQHILCNGESTGTIEVDNQFGTEPVTYEWTPDVSSTNTATNLSAGTYKIVATGFEGRKDSIEITLTEPSPILITEDGITETSCNVLATSGTKNDGGISLTVSGGSPAYSYFWSGGSGSVQGQEDQTTLTASTYYLEVTDDNACVKLDTFLVPEPTKVSHGGSVVDSITIPPGNNGAVKLHTTGGTPSYTFSWTGPPGFVPAATDSIKNLEFGGNYNLEVTDGNSCSFDTTFNVPVDTGLSVIIDEFRHVSCKDDEDGYIRVLVTSGGTGSYSYAWRKSSGTPVGINSAELADVPAGTYICKVTDLENAKFTEVSKQIQEPSDFLAIGVDSLRDISCNGETDGRIYISVNGGWGGRSFQWTPTNKITEDIQNLAAGLYTVQVSDTGLNTGTCVKQYTDIAVLEPTQVTVNILQYSPISCNGGSDGRLQARAAGGSPPYLYFWDDPGAQNDSIANDLSAGLYSVDVQDANGCPATNIDFSLIEPTMFVLVSAGAAYDTATGETTIAIELSGGTAPYTYKVSGSGSDSIVEASTTKEFNYSNGGNFTIMADDANNCGPFSWDTTEVSVGELLPGINVALYPNPSEGQFTLELDNKRHEDLLLEIISITGQQVFKKLYKYDGQDRFIQTIDLGGQADGTYFMRVNGLSVKAKIMLH